MATDSTNRIARREFAAVFVGGIAGTLLRFGLLELFPLRAGAWPWATFIANIAGCAILSYVITHLRVSGGSSVLLALLGTGLCGALTTFSTMQLELYRLIDGGDGALARQAVERGRELA